MRHRDGGFHCRTVKTVSGPFPVGLARAKSMAPVESAISGCHE